MTNQTVHEQHGESSADNAECGQGQQMKRPSGTSHDRSKTGGEQVNQRHRTNEDKRQRSNLNACQM